MSLVSSVAIYFVIWWLVLFAVLPFGVRSQHEAGELTFGSDHGAPHQPLLVKKAAATTVIAAIIFAAIYLYFGVFQLSLEDLIP
jgi:predicted secreted protein